LGGAAIAAQSSEVALLAYEQALTIRPALARAHAGRGMALVLGGRWPEAIDALGRGVQLDPTGVVPVFLHAGYQMLQIGHAQPALAAFSRLLELLPDQRSAQQGRIIALIALRRFEEALPELALLRDVAPATDYLSGVWLHAQLQCCDWT